MIKDILRSVLIGLIFSLILVLIFAIFVKFFAVSDLCIDVVNTLIKGVSTGAGCVFGIKEQSKSIPKGFFIGLLYYLFTFILFSILNKSFDFNAIKLWYILIPVSFAILFAILKTKKLGR